MTSRLAAGSAEEHFWIEPERRQVIQRRESLLVSWFATGGTFESDRSVETEESDELQSHHNRWNAPLEPGRITLWLVLRDDRGGSAFVERQIEVGAR